MLKSIVALVMLATTLVVVAAGGVVLFTSLAPKLAASQEFIDVSGDLSITSNILTE